MYTCMYTRKRQLMMRCDEAKLRYRVGAYMYRTCTCTCTCPGYISGYGATGKTYWHRLRSYIHNERDTKEHARRLDILTSDLWSGLGYGLVEIILAVTEMHLLG